MDQRSFSEIRVVRVRAGPVGSGRARVVEFSLYIAGACWCRGWLAGVTHAGVMCREVVLAANAVHNERLQAQPTVLLCGSACPLGEYHSYRPTAAIAFSAVILLVVQIRVNFYLFKTSNVNSFGIVDLFFNICSKFIRTLVPSFNKFVNARCKKRSRQLRKPLSNGLYHFHMRQISVYPAFSSSGPLSSYTGRISL